MYVTSDSSRPSGNGNVPRLPQSVQQHLGELLGGMYAQLRSEAIEHSHRLALLSQRFLETSSNWTDTRDRNFHTEILATLPSLNRFALSLTRHRAQADDLVQDTLLKGWKNRLQFDMGTNLTGWLFTIMRNTFHTEYRKQIRQKSTVHIGCNGALPEQQVALDLQDVRNAMTQLPSDLRQSLILVAVDNLSYEQAAEIMNCRIGTVKSRVFRAREKLAEIIGHNNGDLGPDAEILAVISGSPFREDGFAIS